MGNKIPKAVRSDKAEFRMGNLGEQGCLSMLGINHSTHRTSITFSHKLLVNKLLNLPLQEKSAATGFSVPVTQPSQKFWSPPPYPFTPPPTQFGKEKIWSCPVSYIENREQ